MERPRRDQRGVPRGGHSKSGADDISENDFVDVTGMNLGAFKRRAKDMRGEVHGVEGRQSAEKLADGRAHG